MSAREQHFHSQVRESTVRGRAAPRVLRRAPDLGAAAQTSAVPWLFPPTPRPRWPSGAPTGSAEDRLRRPASLTSSVTCDPVTCSPSPHLCLSCHPLPSPFVGLPRATGAPAPPLCPPFTHAPSRRHLYPSPITCVPPPPPPQPRLSPACSLLSSLSSSAHLLSLALPSHHLQPFPAPTSSPSVTCPNHLHLIRAHFSSTLPMCSCTSSAPLSPASPSSLSSSPEFIPHLLLTLRVKGDGWLSPFLLPDMVPGLSWLCLRCRRCRLPGFPSFQPGSDFGLPLTSLPLSPPPAPQPGQLVKTLPEDGRQVSTGKGESRSPRCSEAVVLERVGLPASSCCF